MQTLFPIESHLPEGFHYFPDFISKEEEKELINAISKFELHNFQFHGYEGKRKVASFGYDWSFEKRMLSKGKEIPSLFTALIEKTANHLSIKPGSFGELLLTEYPVGSVINWHRDAPPFEKIAGISLGADCIFRLRPYDKAKQNRKSVRSLSVQRCSLYLISDEARSEWEHSTLPVKDVRYSITLRTLKEL